MGTGDGRLGSSAGRRASGARQTKIAAVGFGGADQAGKRRHWWSKAEPESFFCRLGPLQYVYHRPEAGTTGALLQPTAPILAALVNVVHKAGKVLSSVGGVDDKLQSIELQLRSRAPGVTDVGVTAVAVVRLADFLVAFPTVGPRGLMEVLGAAYVEFERLRLWLAFMHANHVGLPQVVEAS